MGEEGRRTGREKRRFDPILKEIISKSLRKILILATSQRLRGRVKFLGEEMRLVKVLRPDVLFEIDDKIIHIEIQVQGEKTFPERMHRYYFAIRERFGKSPIQIVLFIGKGRPPPNSLELPNLSFKFIVLDMKKIDPDFFIKSDKPEEIILGILAGSYKEKSKVFRDVVRRISEIVKRKEEVIKYIDRINFLASLFEIERKELEAMPIKIDITKSPLYKLGEKRGFEEGKQKGLKEGEQKGILKGLKKGIIEGLKEAILMGVELRFGYEKSKQVRNLLEGIEDIRYLRRIKKGVIGARSWEDFVKIFQNSNSSKKKQSNKKLRS